VPAMSDEVWGETPQEAILDCIYESVVAAAGIEMVFAGRLLRRFIPTKEFHNENGACSQSVGND
jgi:hypothetical protein